MRRILLFLACLALATPAFAQDPPRDPKAPAKDDGGPPPKQEGDDDALPRTKNARQIRALVRDLGSPDWATREAAREKLLDLGSEALPYLERATRDKDLERRTRASELLKTMRWLVPEELRRVIGDALDGFPNMQRQQRQQVLRVFLQRPHEARIGLGFLITVARFDPDSTVRQTAVRVYLRVSGGKTPRHDDAAFQALADEKDSPVVFYLRAQLLQRLERTAEATKAAEQALAGAPTSPQIRSLLIDLYLEADRAKDALPLALKAAEAAPQDLVAAINLGEVLVRAGQRDEGLARLGAVLDMVPPDKEGKKQLPPLPILLRLGQAYLRCGEPDEATGVYKQALGRFPFNRELNVAMGDVLQAQGRIADAVQVYLSEIRYAAIDPPSPEFIELRKRLSEILKAGGAGWLAEQDAFFEDAHRGRAVVAAHRAVGDWLRRRGLFEEAAAEQRVVTSLVPGSAVAWLELGEILEEGRDYEGAKAAYEKAKELAPKESKIDAKLRDVAILKRQQGEGGAEASPTGFALWETRIDEQDLARGAEAVSASAPPPQPLGNVVVVPAPGVVELFGLAKEDGRVVWRYAPEPPPRREGELPEQLGLELVGLVSVSPGVVAATSPTRALKPEPLGAALYNVFWRPAHRSWKKAKFRGLRAYLFDPADGSSLGSLELGVHSQVRPPAGTARGARMLTYTSRRKSRVELELMDLVLGRARWQAKVPKTVSGRPLFAGDRILISWRRGVSAMQLDGKPAWIHTRQKAAPNPEDGEDDAEPEGPAPLTTGLAVTDEHAIFGTADGRLIQLALSDGAVSELARPTESRLVGELALGGGKVYAAARGGAVYAVRLPEGDSPAETAWTSTGPKMALRTLCWTGGKVFALNGSGQDFFRGEVAVLQALDPETGAVGFQRPVARPARISSDAGLVVVASGGAGVRGGLRVLGAHPESTVDAQALKVLELRSAAADALVDKQFEVAAIVVRKYLRLVGLKTLDDDGYAFVARVLARSNRPGEALDVIHEAEHRAGAEGQKRWDGIRKELGLEEEEEAEAPPKRVGPPPGIPKKPDGPDEGKPGAKPWDPDAGGAKPKPDKPGKLPRRGKLPRKEKPAPEKPKEGDF